MFRLVVAFAFCAALAGCKRTKDGAPPCDAVGAKFLVLARADLASSQPDEKLRRSVEDQLPAMRDSIVHACTDTAWSSEVRKCLVDAADHPGFEVCEAKLTDAQRAALARGSVVQEH